MPRDYRTENSSSPTAALPRSWAAAAILATALLVYGGLLASWHRASTPAPPSAVVVEGDATKLRLSTRLSGETATAPTATADPGERRGWLLPLLAFVLPLAAGALIGSHFLARRREEPARPTASGARADAAAGPAIAPDSAAAEPEAEPATDAEDESETWDPRSISASAAQEGGAATAEELASAMANATASEPPAALTLSLDDVLQGEEGVAPLLPAATVEGLREQLKTRQEVIAALEKLVRDNREQWFRSEEKELDFRRQIAQLEEDLGAAERVIAELSPTPAAQAKPQVLGR